MFKNYAEQVQRLLREAALECNLLLSLVTLHQNGKVVNITNSDTDTANAVSNATTLTGTSTADIETELIIRRFCEYYEYRYRYCSK